MSALSIRVKKHLLLFPLLIYFSLNECSSQSEIASKRKLYILSKTGEMCV